jgi:CheY-like chemotaxis protein
MMMGMPDPQRLAGLHIFVVDDNRDARDIITTLLEYYGALVTAVPSADAALRLLRHVKPDLLISDLAMPKKDGATLIREVRKLKRERGGATPALAVSGYDQDFARQAVLNAGFQDYLVKPVDIRTLCTTIERLVAPVPTPP